MAEVGNNIWLASEMAAFARVSELKSFTAAARSLGVPKVAISRAIASLEKRLGTRLLTRTTRRVTLTAAGSLLQPHCQRLLSEVEAVQARFQGGEQARLRLVVDAGYGRLLVTPLVPRFLERFPGIELQVALIDALPAEPAADWDLLICNGECPHPAFRHAELGNPPQLLCATPAYLSKHGRPRGPADLDQHTVLQPLNEAGGALRLRRERETVEVRLRPGLAVSDPALVHSSTAAGLGIGVLPEFLCRQGLAMGKLERVLPEWALAQPLQLRAVYAADHESSSAVRQFIEFLLANMVAVLGAV